MTAPADRRGFLRGLASLPLIGGSVALIGQPTAVAGRPSLDMLEAYKTWLHFERRLLSWEISKTPEYASYYRGRSPSAIFDATEGHSLFVGQSGTFHVYDGSCPASSRAALVLSAVGCDWRTR